jgi:hypothetical protein
VANRRRPSRELRDLAPGRRGYGRLTRQRTVHLGGLASRPPEQGPQASVCAVADRAESEPGFLQALDLDLDLIRARERLARGCRVEGLQERGGRDPRSDLRGTSRRCLR